MTVDSPKTMDQVAGMCCHQSPLRGIIGALILCACFIGAVVLLWQQGFHWIVWSGCAVLAALLVPWFFADAQAKFRSANWLFRLGPDGLWINLRSCQNCHLPDAPTVLHLRYEEIASAHRHLDTWSTPSEPSSLAGTHWKLESLELSLVSGVTRTYSPASALIRDRLIHSTRRATRSSRPCPGAPDS